MFNALRASSLHGRGRVMSIVAKPAWFEDEADPTTAALDHEQPLALRITVCFEKETLGLSLLEDDEGNVILGLPEGETGVAGLQRGDRVAAVEAAPGLSLIHI